MLLREYKEMLEEVSNHKVTNALLGKALNTSSQNISKRIKGNSELTTSELSKLESCFGVYKIDEREFNSSNSLKRRKTNLSEEFKTWTTRLEKVQAFNSLDEESMAQVLNISLEEYENILYENANIPLNFIKSLVENFEVDLNWLFSAASSKTSTNSDLINSLPSDKFQKLLKLLDD